MPRLNRHINSEDSGVMALDVITIMINPLIEPFLLNAINHWRPYARIPAIEALKTRDVRFTPANPETNPENMSFSAYY
ncbi:MAG: hypothetical protein LBT59_00695 [Clostridiales bacterium]|jgi:hypothetical protein|nr:hypothetical protein [Clostridiales bacterium]